MKDIDSKAPMLFLAKTILCQIAAGALIVIGWQALPHVPTLLVAGSLCAFGMATLFSLSPAWRGINLMIPISTTLSMTMEVPSWIFLVICISLLCVYAPAFWTRVPYYPTPRAAYSLILAELPTDKPFTFLDIGCGFGDLLFFLSSQRPNGRFIGIEISLLPCLMGFLKTKLLRRRNLSIKFKNMWSEPLHCYDVVYTFLSPAPMDDLWEKVQGEMRNGTLFITNTFEVPAPADEILAVKDQRCSHLFLHRMHRNGDIPAAYNV